MFIWDLSNIDHIAAHGVTTDEAEQVINNDPLDIERQFRNGEMRFVHLGETLHGRVLFMIVTPRGKDLRVVTAFRQRGRHGLPIAKRESCTMAKLIETPEFKDEAEEARWWSEIKARF